MCNRGQSGKQKPVFVKVLVKGFQGTEGTHIFNTCGVVKVREDANGIWQPEAIERVVLLSLARFFRFSAISAALTKDLCVQRHMGGP